MIKIMILALFVTSAKSHFGLHQQQTECDKLHSAYGSFCHAHPSSDDGAVVQGKPGKHGGKGEKGDVGLRGITGVQGPPGVIDIERLQELIDRRIMNALDNVSENLSDLSNKLRKVNTTVQGICHLFYDGKCFVLRNKLMLWEEGERVCEFEGWKMANIYSEDHHNMLVNYIRGVIPLGKTLIRYWTGMTMDINTKVVSLSDKRTAPFVKWHPGYPHDGNQPFITLNVRESPENMNQNLWNNNGKYTSVHGVVCEY